jgi:hypothetical protein
MNHELSSGCSADQGRQLPAGKRHGLTLAAIAVLAGCGLPTDRHEILGAGGHGYAADAVEVVADVRVDELQIRQVRIKSAECDLGHVEHLELDGPIGPDATDQLDRLLSSASPCRTRDGQTIATAVYLNSGGGALFHGMLIADVFRFHDVETIVLGGQLCASACAVAFLGGVHRTIVGDGRLLFHAPYTEGETGISCAGPNQAAALRAHFVAFLGPKTGAYVFAQAMRHCSETEGWLVDAATARRLAITTR